MKKLFCFIFSFLLAYPAFAGKLGDTTVQGNLTVQQDFIVQGDVTLPANSIEETMLNVSNSPVDGYCLGWAEGIGLTWQSENATEVVWGYITGTLSDQTDLSLALNAKQNALGYTPVPDSRTVNGHALTGNVTVSKSDVGLGNVENTALSSLNTEAALEAFLTDVGNIYTDNDVDAIFTQEQVEDVVNGLLNDENSSHDKIQVDYNDSLNAISFILDDDLSQYDNSVSQFLTVATLPDPSATNELQNIFQSFAVAGQNTVTASSTTGTLTLIAGTNISLLTDAVNKTITIIGADIPPDDWEDITNKPITAYDQQFDNGDLTAGVIRINHQLNSTKLVCQVFNGSAVAVEPDSITVYDANNVDIDLSSFIPLVGNYTVKVVLAGGDSGGSSDFILTVEEVDGNPSLSGIDTIQFDSATGLNVSAIDSTTVKIALGSHFKDWQVAGQTTLSPTGEETIEIVAGDNVTIETDALASPKQLIINADAGSGSGGDNIAEGNTSVETVDTGDGYVKVTEDGTEILRVTGGNVAFTGEGGVTASLYRPAGDSKAISFDGSDDYLNGGNIGKYTGAFSIHGWIYPTGSTGGIVISTDASSKGYQLTMVANKLVLDLFYSGAFGTGQHTWTSVDTVIPNQWNHFLVAWDGAGFYSSNVKVFMNGSQSTLSFAGSGHQALTQDSGDFIVGRRKSGYVNKYYFSGYIDELRLYNADKSSSYASYWNNGIGQQGDAGEANIALGWHMDEGTGVTAAPYAGSGNLILSLGPTWTTGFVGGNHYTTEIISAIDGSAADQMGEVTVAAKNSANGFYGRVNLQGADILGKIGATTQFKIASDGGVYMYNLKTGTTQAAAGASVDEVWADTDDDYTLKVGH